MKNTEIVEKFIEGAEKGRTKNVFIEGRVIYSYGYHFPMALRLDSPEGFIFIVNKNSYSSSTSRHQSRLKNLPESKRFFVDTYKLKSFISRDIKELKQILSEELEK